jgi:hypothetical protein
MVRHHMKGLEALGGAKRGEENESGLHSIATLGAEGLERVIGIPVEDIQELRIFRPVPSDFAYSEDPLWLVREWHWEDIRRERFASWEGIRRGSNIFIKGLGKFDIMDAYQRGIIQQRKQWDAYKLVDGVHWKYLKPAFQTFLDQRHQELRHVTPEASEGIEALELQEPANLNRAKEVRAFLVETRPPDFDLVGLFKTATCKEGFLKHCQGKRLLQLHAYLYDPWWLLSVKDLQVYGYFGKAVSGESAWSIHRSLTRILLRPEEDPIFQHLVRYSRYWNDPDRAVALDELLGHFPVDLQEGCATVVPDKLLRVLRERREREQKRQAGEDVRYEHLDVSSLYYHVFVIIPAFPLTACCVRN